GRAMTTTIRAAGGVTTITTTTSAGRAGHVKKTTMMIAHVAVLTKRALRAATRTSASAEVRTNELSYVLRFRRCSAAGRGGHARGRRLHAAQWPHRRYAAGASARRRSCQLFAGPHHYWHHLALDLWRRSD